LHYIKVVLCKEGVAEEVDKIPGNVLVLGQHLAAQTDDLYPILYISFLKLPQEHIYKAKNYDNNTTGMIFLVLSSVANQM